MKYAVTITETLQRTVFVDAPDKGQAGYIVGKKYKNGEIVLSADDFLEAEFSTKEAYERWSDEQLAIAIGNWAVRAACEGTSNGNWLIYDEEIMLEFGLTAFQVNSLKNTVLTELLSRDEVLEGEWREDCLDLTVGLDYCQHYDWEDGDEEVFGFSYEEWLEKDALPVIDRPIC